LGAYGFGPLRVERPKAGMKCLGWDCGPLPYQLGALGAVLSIPPNVESKLVISSPIFKFKHLFLSGSLLRVLIVQ